MSTTTVQPQAHTQWNPNFEKHMSKWRTHQWTENQVINPNYSSPYDPEALCQNILHDPRYNRLKTKWDPKISEKGGLKQKAKKLIDPINIPYVGTAIAWNRAGQALQAHENVEKLRDENQNTPQETILDSMQNNTKVKEAGLSAKAGAKTFFMFFPLVYAVPAGDQALSFVAQKVASKSAQKVSEKAVDEGKPDSAQADANETWGATKAFLQYLGEPQSNDPIYQSWETSRLQLKEFFGCAPQDNLWEMEPRGEELNHIQEAEETQGGYDLSSINVPLLVLLWRIYDCWTEQYADKMTTKNHKMTKQQRERAEDEREVLEMISPIDPHIQRLNQTSAKEIVRLLRDDNPWGYGKHSIFSFLEERADAKRDKRLRWMLKTFVQKLLEAETGWGYFSDATNTGKQGELLAVVFFERAEQDHYVPSDVLNTFSGMVNLRTDYSAISKRLSWEDSIMKHQIGQEAQNGYGILHYYGCQPSPQGQQALATLLKSQINYSSIPSYCQEYSAEAQRLQFLRSVGFQPMSSPVSTQPPDYIIFDSKDPNSPRMSVFDYTPAAPSTYAVHPHLRSPLRQA
jgi:hypothetical protein